MRRLSWRLYCVLTIGGLVATAPVLAPGQSSKDGWIELTPSDALDAWKPPIGAWAYVGDVHLDPENSKRLVAEPGAGVFYNGPTGRTNNLVTRESYGDLEAHVEFLIPQGSNSGVKFGGVYEIQILDSFGKTELSGNDCGGIYPRAEAKPKYHYLDKGHAPRTNASRPAGQWQTLDATYRAPRFDDSGKKTASARFVRVVLNGQVIHEDVEATTPTGSNWVKKETATGPFLIQADHGPVAIRNVRIRPLDGKTAD